MLSRYGVDIAFTGHAHIYQRNRKPHAGSLVSYVTGGGGADLQSIGRSGCSSIDAYGIGWSDSKNAGNRCGAAPVPGAKERVYHFLKVSVNGTTVTVTPIDELGRVFDATTYDFSGSGATDTQAPTAPTNLQAAAASASQVNLTWGASSDNVGVAGYKVFRDGAQIATSSTTTYSDTTVKASTTYSYSVVAHDAAGNSSPPSNTATVTTPAGAETLTFSPTDDAFVRLDAPDSNFGSAGSLEVDNSPVKNVLLKFSVSGLNVRAVSSAKLRVWCVDSSSSGGRFQRTANTWDEGTVTWNRAPAGGSDVASLGSVSSGRWYELDVTSLVTGDGVFSLRTTSSSSDGADYSSKEGTAAPQLVVTVQ